MTITPIAAFLLFPMMISLLEIGKRLRIRYSNTSSSSAIESAMFGLFGLLLAFTFSGAITRYDNHRLLLTQETNAIGTAYLRLSLLPSQAQPGLQQLFRDYTTSRLHLFDGVSTEISPESVQLQNQIWQRSVLAASSQEANPDATKLLLPALNDMIDITAVRQNAFNMHPPNTVFLLLFVFSCGSAFIAGYSMKINARDWVYSLAFAASVTFTVYATLEIEYPRQGLIRLTHLDRRLLELRDTMK